MAVVGEAKLQHASRSGTDDSDSKLSVSHVYLVQTDDANDDVTVVLNAPKLPAIGDALGGSRVQSRSVQADANSDQVWWVTVEYQTDDAGDDGADTTGGLRSDGVPKIEFGLQQRMVPVQWIAQGSLKAGFAEGITNSAGQPFDPSPMYEVSYEYMRINALIPWAKFKPAMLTQYKDTLNNRRLLEFPSYSCRLVALNASTTTVGGDAFWDVGLEWYIKDTHSVFEVDRGTMEINNQGVYTHIIDNDGFPVTSPVLLNGRGNASNMAGFAGGGGIAEGNAEAVLLEFPVYNTENHAALLQQLGLPLAIDEYK
jgi:hypothetical protein